MKQFKKSLAAKGILDITEEKESLRKKEIQLKTEQFIFKLSTKIVSPVCDVEELEKILENTTQTLKNEEMKQEILENIPKYAKMLHEEISAHQSKTVKPILNPLKFQNLENTPINLFYKEDAISANNIGKIRFPKNLNFKGLKLAACPTPNRLKLYYQSLGKANSIDECIQQLQKIQAYMFQTDEKMMNEYLIIISDIFKQILSFDVTTNLEKIQNLFIMCLNFIVFKKNSTNYDISSFFGNYLSFLIKYAINKPTKESLYAQSLQLLGLSKFVCEENFYHF